MTSRQTRTDIQNLLDLLSDTKIAIFSNPVIEKHIEIYVRVSWPQKDGLGWLYRNDFASIKEYRDWLTQNCYSCILKDGSILQISYTFEGKDLVGHRLAYYPCPYFLDNQYRALLVTEPILDVIDMCDNSTLRLRSPIRFDYDPEASRNDHPQSHLTISQDNCRLAVQSPLSLGHFVRFIFKNFYPAEWAQHKYLREWSATHYDRTINEDEEPLMHLSWRQ